MKNGLIKVAAAIPAVKVADTKFNLIETEKQIAVADGQGVEIIVFPELSLTGYSCQDLFQQQLLLDDAEQSVLRLLEFTRQLDITVIVGAPVTVGPLLLNCAIYLESLQRHSFLITVSSMRSDGLLPHRIYVHSIFTLQGVISS